MRLLAILVALGCASRLTAADPPPYADPELKPADRQHWSFVPPKRAAVPSHPTLTNPIDRFVVAKLAEKRLKHSPAADKLTLVRRVTFDLTGLPPTPAEIDAFLADTSPDAYEKLVDRLLASPHYGERWAQHWLDVVRYADTNGFEVDADRPQAWRYRDYVVRSLNADKPYDVFLTEQLAGDILAAGKPPREAADLWHATGLHRCGQVHVVSGNVDKEEGRQEVLTEMVTGVSSAVMGLTVGCARCHDHKFDPISLGDYYRLQAFFAGTMFKDVDLATPAEKDDLGKQLVAATLKAAPLKKQIAELEKPYREKLVAEKRAKLDPATRAALETDAKKRTDEQKKLVKAAEPDLKVVWDEVLDALNDADRKKRAAIRAQLDEVERELPALPPQAWAVADEKAPPTHVLRRGDLRKKAGTVSMAYPRVIEAGAAPKNRLDLAKWLTRPDHPLTARVIVNRLWQHHFGRGIVGTPNDFGTRGDRPTHPELLDWLACEFVEPSQPRDGRPWALKRLHKLMVTSATYQQTSRGAAQPADPDNRLLWRMNRRRMEAEAIRDAMLTVAGTLTREVGGPTVKVPLEPEVYDLIFTEGEPAGLWPVTVDVKQHTRRSLYLFLKRTVRLPVLEAFDQPDTINSCAARPVSTFAPQALILMNGPLAREQSQALAAELLKTSTDAQVQVTALYRRALGRVPTAAETKLALEFLSEQAALLKDDGPRRALADLCLAVFNTNEFVYIP